MEHPYQYQPYRPPPEPRPEWHHAYISVYHHPGKGWKWAYFCGLTRSPKDAKWIKTGIVEEGSRNTAELVAFEDMMRTLYELVYPVARVRVYCSEFLRHRFSEPDDPKAWYYPWKWWRVKPSHGNDEHSKRIDKMLSNNWECQNIRFSVARDSFVGKRFADELASASST